ncbi:MAG: fused MFS/spermidine synthase [Acidobacteria bacterium]|nr:fused MFS/spermidine synthase [Acidobacteriota bacterium]
MLSGRRVFVGAYAGSGAAALIYEVAWTRLLTLQLGHTVAAASTVLAAFMGGLALGAAVAGRFSDSALTAAAHARRLRRYAALEIFVAIVALLLPLALAAAVPALAWAYADGSAPARFALVRVAISLALLCIPAAAMGATFPIAAEWFAGQRPQGSSAADAGLLYAANTAGAAVGAILGGFFLIPAIGLHGTIWIGVALNLVAAAIAFWLAAQTPTESALAALPAARHPGVPHRTPKKPGANRARPVSLAPPAVTLACAAAGVSGFVALVYEVAWTRLLALVLGPTTYAFATMAAAFITGIAIGSALGARVARRTVRPGFWLALTLIVCALAATTAAWYAAVRVPLMVAAAVAAPDAAFGPIVFWQALGVSLLLLPTTLALGAVFPLALTVASGDAETAIARDVARVYAANTFGAIAGALAGGFLLIPALGLRASFHSAALVGLVAGIGCLVVVLRWPGRRMRSAWWGAAAAAAAAGVVLALPPWDRDLLASGAYKYAPYLGAGDLETVLRAGELEYYKEGAAGTVSVRRLTGTLSMAIDGKVDASNASDMLTQRLLGLMPMLLHENPQDVCVIGLGSGVTVGSALASGTVRRADVVEISPEVVAASRLFDRESGNPLAKPEVNLIVGDGRSHLLLTRQRYDVIVSEPSNPWMAGVAALFTREFFEAARARLKPDGLLCQWAHTYDISGADLRSIVRTFSSVFPQGTMWLIGDGDLLLIGTNGDAILPRLANLATAWRRGSAPEALASVGISGEATPFALLSLLAGGPDEIRQYGASAPIQTDDRMALEFSAPRGIYGRMANENSATIRALSSTPIAIAESAIAAATDDAWVTRGNMELRAQAFQAAYDAFQRALALNTHNAGALEGLTTAAAEIERLEEAKNWLERAAASEPSNVPVRLELSKLLASLGDFDGAATQANQALRTAPDDPAAGEQLASVLADAGDGERLTELAQALASRYPERPASQYYVATAHFLTGQTAQAADEARRLVQAHPDHARGFNLLGAACATDGQRECAKDAFQQAIRLNPREVSTYVNLGRLLIQMGDSASAAGYLAEALTLDPRSAAAREGLAQAKANLIKP